MTNKMIDVKTAIEILTCEKIIAIPKYKDFVTLISHLSTENEQLKKDADQVAKDKAREVWKTLDDLALQYWATPRGMAYEASSDLIKQKFNLEEE